MIAFDNSQTDDIGSGTTGTRSYTVGSGANRLLFVCVFSDSGDLITGVTYAGVAMTQLVKRSAAGSEFLYIYYLANPASGANNIVISASGATYMFACSSSYSGVRQTTPIDNSNSATGTTDGSGNFTMSTTVSIDGDWIIMFARGTSAWTAGTNITLRGSSASTRAGDTNASQTAGSKNTTMVNDPTTTAYGLTASFIADVDGGFDLTSKYW